MFALTHGEAELTKEGKVMIIDRYTELVGKIEQEEQDGTYPAWQKRRGLLLPGLSGAKLNGGMVASDVAQYLPLSNRAIRHYQRGTRGVKSIAVAKRIASIVGCPLSEISTYEELARYHNHLNSLANRMITSTRDERSSSGAYRPKSWTEKTRGLLSRIFS